MENKEFISKSILHTGTKTIDFVPGTKVVFHFKTTKCDHDKTLIDDSRVMGQPMELVLGKKFKLEVWEAVVQKMALNEVAVFRVNKSLVTPYPFVSKTLRDVKKPQGERKSHHCCGVTLQNEGIGYPDLDDLIRNPQDLEFTIELLEVVQPGDYEKETWQMTEDEKLKNVSTLREKGNYKFKEKDYKAASDMYATALGLLEQLMLAEKPEDEEWLALNDLKMPLLLNFAQCKLLNKEYYATIEHCSTVLKRDPNNVKGLYRRGKAHIGAWNEEEAIKDLRRAAELDPSLKKVVDKELQSFAIAVKQKEGAQKKKLSRMFE